MTDVAAIVAAASGSRGIGFQGNLPWRLPGDMKHFKQVTSTPPSPGLTNAVIMGRKTWESIPPKFRPLPGRVNVVLSRGGSASVEGLSDDGANNDAASATPVFVATSLDEAMTKINSRPDHGTTFIIGGGEIYNSAMKSGLVKRVLYTNVMGLAEDTKYDAFFPEMSDGEWESIPYTAANAAPVEGANEENENANTAVANEEQRATKKAKVVAEEHLDKKSGLRYEFWDYIKRRNIAETSEDATAITATEEKKETTTNIPEGPEINPEEMKDKKSGLRYEFWDYIKRRNIAETSEDATATASTATEEKKETTTIPEGPEINPEEMQYLNICRDIIENGVQRGDRTGTGTLSKFGVQMRYSLRDNTLPLLTTKRTFWRGVAEELLWFISGSTNANELAEKNIHIWDGNGSREFLDSRGLQHREEGDLGPVYGFQWRHFGAEYKDMHADYKGKGVDQLADCIEKIKNNPEDRRIVMSAWNPSDLEDMALPPCHMFCQFYVDTEKNELSCQMYQRSADMGLGVPFNIASYALLTHMIAKVTGRKPGDFVHTIGDAHVYLNHVDAIKEQLERKPRAFPTLKMKEGKEYDIDGFEFDDFEVVGYKPHKTIKMKMAV
eukprot:CAMPEP_0202029234 /NCGR_PEP_ID=MMETSP0905-20130828/63868_1 /ASSEMBLY_ACC=CAM_ASM_000554 /TAXON_ID=420261 /ORGANISM="Thalassiosira antarctica, Strain CCMP982" /LENGTH=610 /DNA_ID=CAMNT_0048592979 /DNA_START=96 /DNA_END=1929 /DNA_ORIENTATION=+